MMLLLLLMQRQLLLLMWIWQWRCLGWNGDWVGDGRGHGRGFAPLLVLVAMLALMLDEFVVSLEHRQALLALIVESRRALEAGVLVGVGRRLILVDFARFLTRVLEPDDDHARGQVEKAREMLQIVVLRVRVLIEKLLFFLERRGRERKRMLRVDRFILIDPLIGTLIK